MEHLRKGGWAEQEAATYLEAKGYRIVERNYRFGKGEIDIICWKNPFLVFVEVKYRKNNDYGYPEDFVDARKLNRVKQTAVHFMSTKQYKGPVRYDVVSITGKEAPIHFEDVG